MKKLAIVFVTMMLGLFPLIGNSMEIVRNGRAVGRLVVSSDSTAMYGARLFNRFLGESSGAQMPIVSLASSKVRKGDIVIGASDTIGLRKDGFRLKSDSNTLRISALPGKGLIYGTLSLVEKGLGVNYYGANEYDIVSARDISIPYMDVVENPAFAYRQSQGYMLGEDPVYRLWMRLEEPNDVFAASMWVHTFNQLLPSDIYGKSHPEYYSFINGCRRPGHASQWCLSNPELFEVVAERIDSIFEANPSRNIISVSQNDGNFTYCTCDNCKAIYEEEGSVSGAYVKFLNKLAARRPDKQFSTLAYLFTMQPPHKAVPLPNVNIMLCDIDVKREVPLGFNDSGKDFVKALTGWSAISNNLFIWDYGINFDNYLAPFPNFPIIQKNIQLFRDNHATMHFSQIAGSKGGDFAEMRTYMVSKLMWNPNLDADSLMRTFLDGYYGAAAPSIYEYEKLLEGALLASDVPLWIYDSPVSHKEGMLNDNLRRRYNELFDKAEAAVKDDSIKLARVQRQRLSLQYSELEIARAEGKIDPAVHGPALDLFEERCKKFNVPTLNERSNSPVDYCQLYRSRYLEKPERNLAAGTSIQWLIPPTGRYKNFGAEALTDGILGGTTYVESWVGWEGGDGEFIIDLGEEHPVSYVGADCLHQLGAWIFFPKFMRVEYSVNGDVYKPFGEISVAEDKDAKVKFMEVGVSNPESSNARYLRLFFEGTRECPAWHYGVGMPGWFFIDEIIVK